MEEGKRERRGREEREREGGKEMSQLGGTKLSKSENSEKRKCLDLNSFPPLPLLIVPL